MNKWIICLLLFSAKNSCVDAREFNSLDTVRREQLVEYLSEAINRSNIDIIIFQARVDEPFRLDSKLPGKYMSTLYIQPVRFICSLKGEVSLSPKDLMYIYNDDTPSRPHIRYVEDRPLYFPVILNNDSMWFAFVEQIKVPKTEQIKIRATRYELEMKCFIDDGQQMSATDFMRKHNLTDVFSQRVYAIYKGCAFRVEHPPLDWSETKLMKMNKHLLDPMKQGAIRKQEIGNPLWLTDKEVAEIVRLSHAACSDNRLEACKLLSTQTVSSEDRVETKIAKKLLEALVIAEEEKESKEPISAREKGVLEVK